MDIRTNYILLTPYKLYKIILREHYQTRPWFVLLNVAVLVLYYMVSTNLIESLFWVRAVGSSLLLGLLFYTPIQYWRTVTLSDNRALYLPRKYNFSDTKIFSYVRDQLVGENEWETTLKVETRKDFYLLYVTATKFLFLPKKAFVTEEEHDQFRSLLWEWHLVNKEPTPAKNNG